MLADAQTLRLLDDALPAEIYLHVTMLAGGYTCVLWRNIASLRGLLRVHARQGNHTTRVGESLVKACVQRRWSEGLEALIRSNFCPSDIYFRLKSPPALIEDMCLSDWAVQRLWRLIDGPCRTGFRLPVSLQRFAGLVYSGYLATGSYTRAQWYAQQMTEFTYYFGEQAVKHGMSLAQLSNLCVQLSIDTGIDTMVKMFLDHAATYGRLDLLRWIWQQKGQAMSERKGLMERAAARGHLESVKFLFTRCTSPDLPKVMHQAVMYGHYDVVVWLYETKGVTACERSAMVQAAKDGHMNVLRYLLQNYIGKLTSKLIDHAAEGGHLDLVIWLYDHTTRPRLARAINWATCNGHVDVVNWLLSRCPQGGTRECFVNAARAGHYNVLTYLFTRLRRVVDYDGALDAVLSEGHLDICKYLIHRPTFRIQRAPYGARVALRKGFLDVAHWFHCHTPWRYDGKSVTFAAESGSLDLIKWLERHATTPLDYTSAFDYAVKAGHIGILKWIAPRLDTEPINMLALLNDSAKRGYLDIVRFLYEQFPQRCARITIKNATENGQMNVLQYLQERQKDIRTMDTLGDLSKSNSECIPGLRMEVAQAAS